MQSFLEVFFGFGSIVNFRFGSEFLSYTVILLEIGIFFNSLILFGFNYFNNEFTLFSMNNAEIIEKI